MACAWPAAPERERTEPREEVRERRLGCLCRTGSRRVGGKAPREGEGGGGAGAARGVKRAAAAAREGGGRGGGEASGKGRAGRSRDGDRRKQAAQGRLVYRGLWPRLSPQELGPKGEQRERRSEIDLDTWSGAGGGVGGAVRRAFF